MTENEWLVSEDPTAMLAHVQGGIEVRNDWGEGAAPTMTGVKPRLVSDRKLRLFAAGCCRLVWPLLTDARSRAAVDVAERFADGAATEEEMNKADREATTTATVQPKVPALRTALWVADTYTLGWLPQLLGEATKAGFPPAAQAALLREVVGNPFRPVTLCGLERKPFHNQFAHVDRNGGFWLEAECPLCTRLRTPTVTALALAAYSEPRVVKCGRCGGRRTVYIPDGVWRKVEDCPDCSGTGTTTDGLLDPDRLGVLADALEDAGCPLEVCGKCGRADQRTRCEHTICVPCDALMVLNPLFTHLRSPGPHARGCWALDLVLGKE